MNRDDFEKFVIQNDDASFDYPWKKSPKNEVFRHKDSKKWFALVMNVQKGLGSDEDGMVDVVNFKCDKKTDQQEIFEEVIGLLHSFSMRMYSGRRKKIKEALSNNEESEVELHGTKNEKE